METTDGALVSNQTASRLNLVSQLWDASGNPLLQGNGEPKLQPDAVKKLLPAIEAFVARDKYS